MVGFVRRRGWGLLWGFLVQWNGMSRSVTERFVEALSWVPSVIQFAQVGMVGIEEMPTRIPTRTYIGEPFALTVGRVFFGKTPVTDRIDKSACGFSYQQTRPSRPLNL